VIDDMADFLPAERARIAFMTIHDMIVHVAGNSRMTGAWRESCGDDTNQSGNLFRQLADQQTSVPEVMSDSRLELDAVTAPSTGRAHSWEDARGRLASQTAIMERQTNAVRILIVDDDPTIRSVLEALLEDEGFTPVTAANGREAVTIVRDSPPALVLMDLMMPVMSGVDAARALKTEPETANVPIIAMSAGFVLRESIDDLLADSIISKPFDLDALIANIRATLRRANPDLSD
jgi:CheY-like chemotaxis protein